MLNGGTELLSSSSIVSRLWGTGVLLLLLIGFLAIALPAQAAVTPSGQVLVEDHFASNSGLWTYSGTAQRSDDAVQLTPSVGNTVGTLWLNQTIAPPFTVTFKFRISDSSSHADGIVFMFNKQKNTNPVSGGGLGFEVGTGYGVKFDTWRNSPWDFTARQISLFKNNPQSTQLVQTDAPTIVDGDWHNVRIEVTAGNVKTYMDDTLKLDWTGTLDNTYNGIGFAASTGASQSRHQIDDVVIARPSSSNADLSTLSLEGQTLPFQPGTTSYQLTVPYETSVAQFHFSRSDPNASIASVTTSSVTNAVYGVTPTGASAPLDIGPNTIGITVKAEDGSTKLYTVIITRIGATNAFLNEITPLNGELLSPAFQSGTFLYDVYVPANQPEAHLRITLSDASATYSITEAVYGMGSTNQLASLVPGGPILLSLSTQQSWYDIKVTAQDNQTFKNYRIQIRPVPLEKQIGFARMADEETLEVAFMPAVQIPSAPNLPAFRLSGTEAAVIQWSHVPVPSSSGPKIRLKLDKPILPGEIVQLNLLQGAVLLPNNQPLLQMNVPVLTNAQLNVLSQQLDISMDGVHIDDVVRFMNTQPDLNGNGQYDRYDVQVLLGLIH